MSSEITLRHKTCITCDHCCFHVVDGNDDYRCNLAVHILSGEPPPALLFRMLPSSLEDEYLIDNKYLENPCDKEGVYWEPILDSDSGKTVYVKRGG